MDQKEVKTLLKEAKEAIKNREIDKALRLCRVVLKGDNENYFALVIFGAALQESKWRSEALETYRKAVAISPNQILAWQGLASYYEKEKLENVADELLSIYKHLILLEKDASKWLEIFKKVDKTITRLRNAENIGDFATLLDGDDCSARLMVSSSLLQYFSGLKDIPNNLLNIYKKAVLLKMEECDHVGRTEYVQLYIDVLNRQKDYETVISIANELLNDKEELNKNVLELICEAYCHVSCKQNQCIKNNKVELYVVSLLDKNINSRYGQIAKGILLYEVGNYIECRDVLNRSLEFDSRNWLIHYYLTKVYLLLRCSKDALNCVAHVQDLVPVNIDIDLKSRIMNLHLKVMAQSDDVEQCNQCLNCCMSLPLEEQEKPFITRCFIEAAITLSKWNLVEEKLNKLVRSNGIEVNFLRSLYLSRTGELDKAVNLLLKEIYEKGEEEECLQYWILLGELYWKQEKKKDAFDSFLRAAKLSSYIYTVFLYLGHYYRTVANDLNKARRCYQKAFQLNPRCEKVGIALSDMYRILNLQDDNYKLLDNITAVYGDTWAWIRLGLHNLHNHDIKAAVRCLRVCVRNSPRNSYCWELLGDACFARGSFTAALKCYQKCLDLDHSSFYANLQSALVKQRIGLYEESILALRTLKVTHQNSVPVLKGLAEACLLYVRELQDKQMMGLVRDVCEEAAMALITILTQNNKLTCVWKLLADTCILVCQLPSKLSYLKLPSILSKPNSKTKFNKNTNHQLDTFFRNLLLDAAVKFYETALCLNTVNGITSSSLWYDMAFAYNLKATYEDDQAKKRQLAFSMAKKSVSWCPKQWKNWNLLGVIALSKEINNMPLAQHCFIEAIKLETNTALAWSNLGTLYLQLEDICLANEAFQMAQKIDPKYSRSWIGQAFIAEMVDHTETVDLFYHTTVLGYHQESAKGFAEWICKILKDWKIYEKKSHCHYVVKNMYGLQTAATALSWYAVYYPDDISAVNMLAVLLELCGLNKTAVSVLENSLHEVTSKESDIVYSNLVRQLRKLGRYDEAIKYFKRIKQIDFENQCDFALALFLDGRFEEALNSYESAIHWQISDDELKAQAMVAVAALKYLNNEKKEAQAMLLECTRFKPVPVHGLFATCAFGILNNELMLWKLVLRELEMFQYREDHVHHIALFNSYYQIFRGNFKTAIVVMSKHTHNHPGNASLWLSLCLLLLQLIVLSQKDYHVYSTSTAYHAKCAMTLGRGVINISKISSIISLSYLLAGQTDDCIRNSRKAVFMHPDVAENWAVLIAAYCSQRADYPFVKNLTEFIRDKLICSKELSMWLRNIEEKFRMN